MSSNHVLYGNNYIINISYESMKYAPDVLRGHLLINIGRSKFILIEFQHVL
ncbi:MAG: hypothetical protein ACJARM_002401 [Glaciecola sp.]|jgi:hypothetical protein